MAISAMKTTVTTYPMKSLKAGKLLEAQTTISATGEIMPMARTVRR